LIATPCYNPGERKVLMYLSTAGWNRLLKLFDNVPLRTR